MKSISSTILFVLMLVLAVHDSNAQQDIQYTHYMYNTMGINPGYAGSRGHLTINTLVRFQWVGIEGSPRTQTLGIHSPVGYGGLGLGLNIVNDELGPAQETYFDGNASYRVQTGEDSWLAFGLKFGGRLLNVDWAKGAIKDPDDDAFRENINNFLPTFGGGLYHYTDRYYVGLSVPNFLMTDHYDSKNNTVSTERMHFFLIGGYVFDLSESLKFKPAFLVKGVSGAPIIADVSANFLLREKVTLGVAWRWDDSVSALMGFQINNKLNIGYSYDLTTTRLGNHTSGTHEVMLKYEVLEGPRLKSPRFF